jgi:hypothetical protein
VNMIQPKSDQDRFTAERVVRIRPKTYRAIVQLLADPDARIEHIAQRPRVSTHTVRAIRAREAVAIAERKQRLMSIFANVAEISAERMEQLAGKASLRDAGITSGIATDKLLALSGDSFLTQTQQNLHLHLQSTDIAKQWNDLLHSLQHAPTTVSTDAAANRDGPPAALTGEKPDTEERESAGA